MNKREWFKNLIVLLEKKNKARKALRNANNRSNKAIDNYLSFLRDYDDMPTEGNYKYKGYLIEIDECNDVEIEVEPKYKKV